MNLRLSPSRRLHRIAIFAAGLLAVVVAARAQTYSATAVFTPPETSPDQNANYQVTVTATNPSGGSLQPDCTPPKVNGLQMDYTGMSTGLQSSISFNGPSTRIITITLNYVARASQAGHYTVPAFDLTINNHTVRVPEASLEVTNQPASHPATDLLGFEVKLPRTDVYVGEKLPMDLQLYWRSDVQPQNVGELVQDNDAFERVQLQGQGEMQPTVRNNQNYVSSTWHSVLTPLKAGEQNLGFSLDVQAVLPGRNSNVDPMIAQFLGPNAMISMGEQEVRTARSAPLTLNVQSLPLEGKPQNFTGGIGNFTADDPSLSTIDLQVGVPITLTLRVSGNGNFDRFNAPALILGPDWRTYPTKDSFAAQDALNYHGTKTFEYVIMPLSVNISSLPAPEVNYFNPDSKTYVELPLKPIPIKVRPPEPGQAAPALPALASTPVAPVKNNDLIGLHADNGGWQHGPAELVLASPYFWAAQAVPAALLAGLVITRRKKLRLENDPAYARSLQARQLAAAALAEARAAAAKGDAAAFYTAAQRALQEAASHDRLASGQALTWPEFDAHLAKRKTPREVREPAREIFEAGDALRFGGLAPDQTQLAESAARLDGIVQRLLAKS